MRKLFFSFLGILIYIISFSQEKSDTSSHIHIDEVVVSANKWEQNIKEIPFHLIILKKQKIEFLNPQTGADLLGASGQVFIQKSQLGGGSPMIRGFATNRVLLVVDGVRLNNAIFRAGNIQNAILMDASNIEASEIIFGPGSVTYGSDAIGGVMDFHTIRPLFSQDDTTHISGTALSRWSSANREKTGHIHVNIGTKKFASLTSFTYSDYDDLRMGSSGPKEYLRTFYVDRINNKDSVFVNSNNQIQKYSGYSQHNLLQKFRYKIAKNLELQYALHYTRSSSIPRYDRLIQLKDDLAKNAEWYYGPQYWMMNSLKLRSSNQTALFDYAKVTIAYQNYEESRHDRKFNDFSLRHKTETVRALSANIDLSKMVAEKGNLFYGIDIVLNTVGSEALSENINTGNSSLINPRYPDGSTWNSYAVYATYKYKIKKKISLQTGIRYNYVMMNAEFDTTFYPFPFTEANVNNGALIGSLGLAYNPNDKLSININFGTGFRAPNVDDIGKLFDSEPGAVVVPNPELKPEYAYNYELGVTKILNNKIKINSGIFYTILIDALVKRDYIFNGLDSIMYDGTKSKVQSVLNAARAYVYGLYSGIEIRLNDDIGATMNFNYQKGEEELEDGTISPLRHASPWFGDIHLTYIKKAFKFNFYINAMGEIKYKDMPVEEIGKSFLYASDQNGNPYSPGWYTLNVKTNYKIKDWLTIMVGIENITDIRYRPYSWGITSPGRNLITALKISF